MALVFFYKNMLETVTTEKTQQLSAFFTFTERTQLNAAHAHLLGKLRPIAFAETGRLLTIQSLEFHEICQNKVQELRE